MKRIVILGTDWSSPGGITAVLQSYKDGGLWQQWPIWFLPTYRTANPFNKIWMALRAYFIFTFWLITGRVAIVHAHSASRVSFWRKSGLLCLAKLFRVKTIFHLHSGEFPVFYHQECKGWQQSYIRWFLCHVDQVIVLTPKWIEVLKGIEPTCSPIALANPVLPIHLAADPSAGRVLFLGRLREKKGVFDLVQAWSMVVAKYPEATLVLAGDGEQKPLLELANKLGIQANIEFPGWVAGEAKARELQRAEIFVLPSHFEGLPVCILEAMAQGVPVVSTRVGGIPDICEDRRDGLLIDAGDIDALASVLTELLGNADLREQIVMAAKSRIETEFAMPVVLSHLGVIYLQLGAQPK